MPSDPGPVVRSDRRHRFGVPPDELWAALVRVHDYRRWWPWLGGLEAGGFAEGERWCCEVRPPLPYVLRFDLVIEEVEAPRFVTASISGDLHGHAALDIVALDGTGEAPGSELRLVSALAPANGALRLIARAAPRLVRFGHDWVLDTGLRQFRERALDGGGLSPG